MRGAPWSWSWRGRRNSPPIETEPGPEPPGPAVRFARGVASFPRRLSGPPIRRRTTDHRSTGVDMKGLRSLVVVCLGLAPAWLQAQHVGADSAAPPSPPPLEVRVDSSQHELVLTAGAVPPPVPAPGGGEAPPETDLARGGSGGDGRAGWTWAAEGVGARPRAR